MRLLLNLALALAALSSAAASAQPLPKPLPLPPPIRFEEACLQSGGAAGAITPSPSPGDMYYLLLEADRPVLFTFNLAEGTRAVTIKWTTADGPRTAIVSGSTTLTVVAQRFELVADEGGPAAWCTRVQVLPPLPAPSHSGEPGRSGRP